MQQQFIAAITYFLQEGRENLPECLKIAFQAAKLQNIEKIVIFTAQGSGVLLALNNFCSLPEYNKIKLVAVTFPQGKRFTAEGKPVAVKISDEAERAMEEHNVPTVRAHLPFDPIAPPFKDRGVLAQDLSLVESALNIFGGSMSLCVQAVTLACDAGVIGIEEHVIAMTSDTAILVQAAPTTRMLRDLVIREILCKPAILSIGRKEHQATSEFLNFPAEPSEPEQVKGLPEATPKQTP